MMTLTPSKAIVAHDDPLGKKRAAGWMDREFTEIEIEAGHLAAARLTIAERRLLLLREERGWSYVQIARWERIPVREVALRLYRAREAFSQQYEIALPEVQAIARGLEEA